MVISESMMPEAGAPAVLARPLRFSALQGMVAVGEDGEVRLNAGDARPRS
jgi:hypothetical protein